MRNNIIAVFIFIAFIIAIRFSGISQHFNVVTIKSQAAYLQYVIQHHYFLSALVYICLYIIMTILVLPVVSVLTLVGGFLFNIVPAVLYTNIGATIGSLCSFLIFRYLLHDLIQQRYAHRFQKINRTFKKQGVWYLLSLRLAAIIPFPIVNILISLTKVSVIDFVWTTSIGIIPGSLVYAFAGQQLGTIDSVRDVFTVPVLLAFLFLAILALMPILLKRKQ